MSKRLDNLVADNTLVLNNLESFAAEQVKLAESNPRGDANRPFNALLALDYFRQARDVAYRVFMELPREDPRLGEWETEYRRFQKLASRLETRFALMMMSANTLNGEGYLPRGNWMVTDE